MNLLPFFVVRQISDDEEGSDEDEDDTEDEDSDEDEETPKKVCE